jgi:phosphate transport system substrate-binding protein
MKRILVLAIAGVLCVELSSCRAVRSDRSVNAPSAANPAEAQTQATIKLASSSSTVAVLKTLAEAYQTQNPSVKIEFISNSQSAGAIGVLENNIADIAGISHKLKPEEDNGRVQYRNLAKDALMVATHNSVTGVTNLTTEQLKAIYAGRITNWKALGGPDEEIIVLDRPEDESAKKLLRQHYLGTEPTTTQAVILNREGELIESLQSTPYSIGTFSLAYSLIEQLPVNRLSLNGIAPSEETLTSDRYQMVRSIGLVWQKTPSAATQSFIEFIFSEEGTKVLREKHFAPVR